MHRVIDPDSRLCNDEEVCGKPSMIISHELGLDAAPDAYKHFDERAAGWTKVVLKPGK